MSGRYWGWQDDDDLKSDGVSLWYFFFLSFFLSFFLFFFFFFFSEQILYLPSEVFIYIHTFIHTYILYIIKVRKGQGVCINFCSIFFSLF